MNLTVDQGELAVFTCTYRTTQNQSSRSTLIDFFDRPFSSLSPPSRMIDRFTLQRNISFNARSSTLAHGYHCTVTIRPSGTQITSETATLTVNCKLG